LRSPATFLRGEKKAKRGRSANDWRGREREDHDHDEGEKGKNYSPSLSPGEVIEMPERVDGEDEVPNRESEEVDEHPADVDEFSGGYEDKDCWETEDGGEEDERDGALEVGWRGDDGVDDESDGEANRDGEGDRSDEIHEDDELHREAEGSAEVSYSDELHEVVNG